MKKLPLLVAIASAFAMAASAQEGKFPCDEKLEAEKAKTEQGEVKSLGAYTPAEPIKRVNPTYPKTAAINGYEGWAKVSYIVDEQGNVVDPVVESFGGHKGFKRSTINAVKKWKFTPAMKDGKPTQSCHNEVHMSFLLEDHLGARASFIKRYRKVQEAINANDLNTAEKLIKELHGSKQKNRYENAFKWSLDANLARLKGDDQRELNSLIQLVSSAVTFSSQSNVFNDDYMAYIYQRLFILNTNAGFFAYALDQAEKLAAFEGQEARYQQILPMVEKLNATIASGDNIFVAMNIDEQGKQAHRLVRSKFAFSDIKGDIDTVEVRCDTHREVFTVAEDNIWNIPESWGECRLMVEGDEGTTFNLVEVGSV